MGFWLNPIPVVSGTQQWVWEQGTHVLQKAKDRRQFNGCPHLPSQNPWYQNDHELLHLLIPLFIQEEICWYVGKTRYWKKSKSKKLDSVFRSEGDQVRGCPGIVHKIKHSPQWLNALQDVAMSDTTKKKCWTNRNWSLHLRELIKPSTFISHDGNCRTSGIYLFVQWRSGNSSPSRLPPNYADCLWDLDVWRFSWLHFKADYVLWRGTMTFYFCEAPEGFLDFWI